MANDDELANVTAAIVLAGVAQRLRDPEVQRDIAALNTRTRDVLANVLANVETCQRMLAGTKEGTK